MTDKEIYEKLIAELWDQAIKYQIKDGWSEWTVKMEAAEEVLKDFFNVDGRHDK